MTTRDIVRAWKDLDYRDTLSTAELAALPSHPAGAVPIAEGELGGVVGANTEAAGTYGCNCTSLMSALFCSGYCTYVCETMYCYTSWPGCT